MNEQFDKALADIYSRFLAVKTQISHADLWLGAEDYFNRVDLEVRRSTEAEAGIAQEWLNRANDVVTSIRYLERHWRPVEGSKTQKYTGYMCSKCQAPTVPAYSPPTGQQMIDRQLCFHCNYWENKAEELRANANPRRIIIDHNIYMDAGYNKKDTRGYLGFGGREFRYRRVGSDEVILTNNLWSGGVLPPEYWPEFPDNAEFVK